MTPVQAWILYAAIIFGIPALWFIACCCVAGRYDRESDRLFEECKRHPELKEEDA